VGTEDMRTSDRVYLELPITVAGTDATGREFVEGTRTLVLSRGGAKIISRHALVPQQRLRIRCTKTGLETDVRVVGSITREEEGCHYGVALLYPEMNLWGINFPSLSGAENPAARMLVECTRCHSQEVVHLDVFELEVLLANERLSRSCGRCGGTTLWTQPVPGEGPLPTSRMAPGPGHYVHERKSPRLNLKVDVCIRHPLYGQEVRPTDNVSQGGFRFRSRKDYPVSTLLEAALPYVPCAANIFTPARIVYREEQSAEGTIAYGVAYLPSPIASSLTGMRISRPG
jgi:hypothetical protein